MPPEPLTRVLRPPDPRSLCPLSSTEFVEPPSNKIPGYATGNYIPLLFPLPLSTGTHLSLHIAVKRSIGHTNFVKQSKIIQGDMVLVTQITLAIM